MPLFGAQFNWWLEDKKILAAVGSNRVCLASGDLTCKRTPCCFITSLVLFNPLTATAALPSYPR